jgi:2-polyprenyl-3-methyl-5-hydroxy-6-metoxy-1,4-benzoquinol methylase
MLHKLAQNEEFTWYYNAERPEIMPLIPSVYHRILEIGCGNGNFRKNLTACPHEYWGVEPHEKAAKAAQEILDKVIVGFYGDVSSLIPDNYFDLIICLDVIEHIDDTKAFLQSISKKLDPAHGHIVFSIPNVRYFPNIIELLIEKDWKYRECGILDETHLRFFTQKSIIRVFNENGFIIEKMKGLNPVNGKKLVLIKIFDRFIGDMAFLQFGIRVMLREKKIENKDIAGSYWK